MKRLSLLPLFASVFALVLLALAAPALAKTSMLVPAIDAQGRGILTKIEASVVPGDGDVYVAVEPLVSVETQQSERIAAKIAAELAKANRSQYDVLYKIVAEAEIVDGPSGGAAMTLLAYAEFSGQKIRGDFAITGSIELGGRIGKVGGVLAKAEAVAKAGKKIFLIPSGQGIQEGVDVIEYAAQKWSLQVVEVANIREAAKIAATPEGSAVEAPKRIVQPLVLPKIAPSSNVELFLEVVEVEVEELNATIEKSVGKVRDLLLKSALEALNNSKKLLGEGYYYSAANLAFIAKINLEAAAANFSQAELNKALNELESESEEWLPVQKTSENFEWVVGGELRYWWARQRLEEVKAKAAVGAGDAATIMKDYFSIKNWLAAAKRIAGLAEKTLSATVADEAAVKTLAANALREANASLAEGVDSEAAFHYYAALKAYEAGNNVAALYDAQFAAAFNEAFAEAEDKTALEIEAMLENASFLQEYNASSWAELYFANSIYNIAEYNRSQETDLLLNALKLQRLAKRLNDAGKEARRALAGASGEIRVVTPSPTATPALVEATPAAPEVNVTIAEVGDGERKLLLLLLVAGIAAIIVAAVAIARPKALGRPRVLQAKEALDKLDNLLVEGRISERTWKFLRRKYLAKARVERVLVERVESGGEVGR